MSERQPRRHPDDERLQAFLDGALPPGERAGLEEHLRACARCAATAESWSALYGEIEALGRLAPEEGFTERVLAGVRRPAPVPLAARIGRRIRDIAGALRPEGHLTGGVLQDLVGGALAGRRAATARRHLAACPRCAVEAEVWRAVVAGLDGLERVPAPAGFAERVMARVRAEATARAVRPTPARGRAAALAGWLGTRRAWAALSGLAVAPAATAGVVVWVLLGHPTLTTGALASFAWWKATELAVTAWEAVAAAALGGSGAFRLYGVVEALASAPGLATGGFLLFSGLTLGAVWIVYRNLASTRTSTEIPHARAAS